MCWGTFEILKNLLRFLLKLKLPEKGRKCIKILVRGQSSPQELKVGPRSGFETAILPGNVVQCGVSKCLFCKG